MTKDDRKKVKVTVDCDTNLLYGDLKGAIAYLTEMCIKYPTATLHEEWSGYEDMSLVFEYWRDETDAEMKARHIEAERQAKRAQEQRKEEELKAKRRKEYDRLKKEFG